MVQTTADELEKTPEEQRAELLSGGETHEYTALCPAGFESALAEELRRLGCSRIRPLHGSVTFFGNQACGLRACLWSRLASRVILVIARVDALNSEHLYQGVSEVAWEDVVARKATIAVATRGGNYNLHDPRYVAMRVKDAVCDRLRTKRGGRPSVDSAHPDLLITCTIHGDRATLGVDLSGESLIDRGYRVRARQRTVEAHAAYLREDMAAFMLVTGDWHRRCRRDDRSVLVDALGTSPVLAAEAASMACDRAPGLSRSSWGFRGWEHFDENIWNVLLDEADERFEAGLATGVRVVVAAPDAGVRSELAEMARRLRIVSAIDVRTCSAAGLDLGQTALPSSLVACVVPDEGVEALLGDQPARLAAVAALTRTPALAEAPVVAMAAGDAIGFALARKPERQEHVKNGSSDAVVSVYPSAGQAARLAGSEGAQEGEGAPAPSAYTDIALPGGGTVGVLVPTSDQYAARLARVAKMRAKWAKRAGVTCYRVYDADLPDYAVTVDLYEGSPQTPGRWVVMSEYAAPREIDESLAARRLADALAITPRVLGVDPSDVFLKVRRRAKGGSQYAGMQTADGKRVRQGRGAIVEEGGLSFEVNFSDYLDTGIFLDHREVRSMLRDMAPDARFLNLFAYTGTASVYAADGDAYSTTTVDMSATYLDWARRNMEQNGFSGPQHEFVQADVMSWIYEMRHSPMRWDLIFVDPPTFSNSAKMRQKGFDVQRDHAELLIGASRILRRGGRIVFSCNLRGFTPDVETLSRAGVIIEDITDGTIPEDFSRNSKVHHVFLLRRTED